MFKQLNEYKSNTDAVMSKMDKMYSDAIAGNTGNLIFRVLLPSDVDIYTNLKINQYDYESEAGIKIYIDDLCNEYARSFEARKEVLDDAIPVLSPVLGIGDYSTFVGGDVHFSEDTSWSKPTLENIEDYKDLEPIGSAPWYGRFLYICEQLMKASQNSGIPFSRGFFSPLDLAGALRGDKLYFDLYDSPDELHGLLDFCADATIRLAEDLYQLAERYLGDTKYGTWYLQDKINMSEDISCMISGELYRKYAAIYSQKVIDHFGTGHMHCHSRAMYLVKEICSLNNVANLWLATDPSEPRPIDHIEEMVEQSTGTCLAIDCESFEEIEANIEHLKKGNFSICLPVKTIEEAVSVTERFNALTL